MELPPDLPSHLLRSIQRGLPGRQAHRPVAPRLAYGRHRGPPSARRRIASVLVALYQQHDRWCFPLIVRSRDQAEHAGQVALPGGRGLPEENSWGTACREAYEELGLQPQLLEPMCRLTPLWVFASQHWVEPWLACCHAPPVFSRDPHEIADVLLVPLADLLDPNRRQVRQLPIGTSRFEAPGFWLADHFVWGATAMMLEELRQLVLAVDLDSTLPTGAAARRHR
jgi:8-oxo-dGTP pyrophosphatase MutT (NUDIX family)